MGGIFSHPAPSFAANDSWTNNLFAGTNADGRLELFEVQTNGVLRHRWQRESLHDWSDWAILGGPFQPGIAVINDSEGRLGVFAVDQKSKLVTYNFQLSSNSPIWAEWSRLRGQTVAAPVAAIQDRDGRVEVFAVKAEGGPMEQIFQDETGRHWSHWHEMGGTFEPGPVVTRGVSGQLQVFARNSGDDVLFHCWQKNPDIPANWSSWTSMQEPLLPGFAVAQNKDGRLEAIGINAANGIVVHAFQNSPEPDSNWSDWFGLHVKMRPGVAVGRCRDGRLEVFTVSPTNNMIYHAFQTKGGATNWGAWTDMSLVGGLGDALERSARAMTNAPHWADIGGKTRSYPVIAKNLEGTLEIFAFDDRIEDVVNHRRQVSGVLNWTDWLSLDATQAQYMSRAWRMEDGLPDNRVQAIAQTPDGYLWVGTYNGLARFDGWRFVPFDVKTMFGMSNSSVTSLCSTRDGALWVGSAADGIARMGGGPARHYTAPAGLSGNSVTAIMEAADRSLWVGTTTGLSHFASGKFVNYNQKSGLLSDRVSQLLQDVEGNIWITTDHGLNCIKGKHITAYTRTNGLPDTMLNDVWQDVPGRFWLGSHQGLILFRGSQFHAYDSRYGLSDRLAAVIRSDSRGNLWVGNTSGLSQFKEGRFFEELDQEGNSFGKINTLFNDREGNLWAGSQEGLFLLTPKRLLVYGRQQALTHNNVTAVLEDDSDALWVGTWGGGLDQLKNETVTAYEPSNGFPFDLISAVSMGRDGTIWVAGSASKGVVQLKNGAIIFHSRQEELGTSIIKALHEDRLGNLWVGGSRGLNCINPAQRATNTAVSQLKGSVVYAISESPDGALWFGASTGLYRLHDGHFDHFTVKDGLTDNHITELYEDRDGTLWIGTENSGLNRYQNGHFTHFTVGQGLFSNEIFSILDDDFDWLWMSCSKGVFRVRKSELNNFERRRGAYVNSIAYGHDDGMASVLCSDGKPGAWKTHDGRLWFATGKGLVAFDPRVLKVNSDAPPVYIEDLLADKHSFGLPVTTGSEIRVPAGRGELEFHYAAPSFNRPERVRFKYQLEGIDPDWIDAGDRRAAYYNNVPPGNYRFRVVACNSDGVWNDTGATASILLLPHFWQTLTFQLFAVVAVTGLVAGTARQITRRKMQRKMELMEQRHAIEKERLRIARDIHDDLGGSLTQIALLGELAINTLANPAQAARHLTKITNSARLNVRALDEIVWAVHPGNDSLDSLVLYLWQFAEEFFASTGTRCRIDAPANIPACQLSSDLRHGIFLLVKEAFHNAVKHAAASEVRLRFAVDGTRFIISIEDNGKGFDVPTVNGSGNGLLNMRRRIEEIGGKMSLSSAPGRGTRVEFVLPLKQHHEAH